MVATLKQRVLSGVFWRMLERLGTQLVGFIVSVLLARLLEPKDFGTITLITVFIALASVFVQGGFGTALVQKKEICDADYNSVFYVSLAVAAFLYVLLFAVAPWASRFYDQPELTSVLRVLSLTLFIGALNSVQTAILTREMKFRLSFYACMIATLFSGAVGIGMALYGMRHWALVGAALSSQLVNAAVLWRVVAWRPQWVFSRRAVLDMFGFSSKMLISGLLDTLFRNLYNIIIGKLFNSTVLGFYSRGQSIPNLVMSSVQGTVSSVIFPALAACQHDLSRVRELTRRMIKSTCFLVFPMMFGLAAVARPLVLVLLTEKWLPCVPYLQLSCITFALWPLHVANLQAFTALGRSDLFLRLEVIKKVTIFVSVLLTYRWGIMAMMIGQVVCSILAVVVNAWPSRCLINYSVIEQASDILPSLGLAAAMSVIVWGLTFWIEHDLLLLTIQCVAGLGVYLIGAIVFRMESARYVWNVGRASAAPWVSAVHGRKVA